MQEKNQETLKSVVSHFKTYDYDAAMKILKNLDQSVVAQSLKYSEKEYMKLRWSEDANLLHILAYHPCPNVNAYKTMIGDLIRLGINPNAIGDGHCTSLMTAISCDNQAFFDYLLDTYGNEINYYCDSVTPQKACALALAITQENNYYFKKLLTLDDLKIDERTLGFAIQSHNKHNFGLFKIYSKEQKETIDAARKKIKELKQKIKSLEKDSELANSVRQETNFKSMYCQ